MQPYQKAAQVIRTRGERPGELLKQAGKVAGSVGVGYLGTKGLEKALPAIRALANPLVPDNIFEKGLSKVDPRFEKFIEGGLKEGYSYEDLRSFVEEKAQKSTQSSQKNIIQKYSPELHQEINDLIQKGALPMQAAAKVYNKYKDVIGKIQKDNKVDWLELVESIFGQANQVQQQVQQQPQQGQQQPQGGGSSQDQIQAALQKIMQM